MAREALVGRLRASLPTLLAVYAFGSRIRGDAWPGSDLDLAVLIEGRADPVSLWTLAMLNILRACEAALDMPAPDSPRAARRAAGARDVFVLLAAAGWTPLPMVEPRKRMVGFRNVSVHDDQSLQLPITVAIIERHLDEFLDFGRAILLRDAGSSPA